MVQATAKRAEKLRREINTHNHSYYVLDDSTISDAEYDCLLQHPGNRIPGPTDSLLSDPTGGGVLANGFTQVTHFAPMLNLRNAFHREDLENRLRRTKSWPTKPSSSFYAS